MSTPALNNGSFPAKLSELREIDSALDKRPSSTTARRLTRRLDALAKDKKFAAELLESFLDIGLEDHPDLFPAERLFIHMKRDRSLSTYLVRTLASRSRNRRRTAAWLLSTMSPASAKSALLRQARTARDQEVKGYALRGVLTMAFNSRTLQKQGIPLAMKAARSSSALARGVAYNFLELFGGPDAGLTLKRAFQDKDRGLRATAACYYDRWSAKQRLSQPS